RVAESLRDLARERDAVLAECGFDRAPATAWQVGQDQVLLGGQQEPRPVGLHEAPERGQEPELACILDPAVLDVKAVIEVAVRLRMPAQVVVHGTPRERAGGPQREVDALLHALAEPIDAAVVNQVLETGVAAVDAVAEVA